MQFHFADGLSDQPDGLWSGGLQIYGLCQNWNPTERSCGDYYNYSCANGVAILIKENILDMSEAAIHLSRLPEEILAIQLTGKWQLGQKVPSAENVRDELSNWPSFKSLVFNTDASPVQSI